MARRGFLFALNLLDGGWREWATASSLNGGRCNGARRDGTGSETFLRDAFIRRGAAELPGNPSANGFMKESAVATILLGRHPVG